MKDKTSILMLIYYFHPMVGGAERQCLLQCETLKKMGCISAVLTTWHRGLRIKENINGITVFRMVFEIPFPMLRRLSLFLSTVLFLFWNHKKYKILHVHQFNALTIASCTAKYITKQGVVCTQTCQKPYNGFEQINQSLFKYLFFKIILNLDRLLAISGDTYRECAENGFSKKLVLLPNGVVLPNWKWGPAEVISIVFVGRLHIQKGADIFIRTATIDSNPKHHYLLLGDGPLRSELEKNATPNITFKGLVCNPERYLEVPGSIFVLPSRAEGLSVALLEAMARGIPSIATYSVSGSKDLAGRKIVQYSGFSVHENLILTEGENHEAVYKAINYLITHKEAAKQISRNSAALIRQNYSIDLICEKLKNIYCEVIDDNLIKI